MYQWAKGTVFLFQEKKTNGILFIFYLSIDSEEVKGEGTVYKGNSSGQRQLFAIFDFQKNDMKKILLVLVLAVFASCSDDEKVDYVAKNEQEIKEYIEENNLDAKRSASGLYYVVEEEGTGFRPTATSNVTVAYKGYFTDKEVFDESEAEGITFNLSQVIAGWTEGITYFKEGGNGLLLVPAALGYGNSDRRGIPGGSVLVFEVELIAVE